MRFHDILLTCLCVQVTCGLRLSLSSPIYHDESFRECDHVRPHLAFQGPPDRTWQSLAHTPHSEWMLYNLYPGVRHIVDIGGNRGVDIDEFLNRNKEALIFTFEPTPYFFGVLKEAYQDNPRVNVSNEGASNTSGEAEFIMDDVGTSGLQSTIEGEHVKVRLTDIDDIFSRVFERVGGPPDVLSMNCEGCEYDVMQRLIEKGWLSKIPFIQLSWHTPDQVNDRVAKRCNIEKVLWQSHVRTYSTEYGWTGWKKVDCAKGKERERLLWKKFYCEKETR